MFTLSSVSRRGQSSALIDEAAHDEPVTNMFDDRRQSRRGRDRTSSRGRDRTSRDSTFSNNSNGGGGGEATVAPSSRGADRRNPSNTDISSSSNSSRRRALEALMTTASSSGTRRTSTTTTTLTHDDNSPTILSPEDVHNHLPAQVRSFQQLTRPVSRGGKLTSTGSSSDALIATTIQRAGQPNQQTRVMSGQPSPRFVFSGDTGLKKKKGGALDVPLDGAHRTSAEGGHHDDDEFPSDDENEGAASRFTAHREENAAPSSSSAIVSINMLGRNAPMPPVESEVLLGSRDEALVNVLNNALVGSIALHTGDARPVVSCIALHGLAKSLKSPAAKQYAVARIVAEVVTVSKAALR
ncbi:Hypothetical protein, putative [Bodo saltans]|uniref:Uncharacterized protein n=1 Tax=Bodo saltans TaxID=75058 RepID=A0A0S4J9P1_BODSA|nr:Hypothetical protein, putative [Bodo saltans]|eukprot:CUG86207.1 Hypothetical protein, putative [Bodo saltans]